MCPSKRISKYFTLFAMLVSIMVCFMMLPFFHSFFTVRFKTVSSSENDIAETKHFNNGKFDGERFGKLFLKRIDKLYSNNWNITEYMNNWWNLNNEEDYSDCSLNSTFWKPNVNNSAANKTLYTRAYLDVENCEEFFNLWNYPKTPFSQEEADYPLAYVFMANRNLGQTLRLFRAVYAPQNVYCINWDADSKQKYKKSMEKLTKCFPNIITPKPKRKISWCHYSLLEATMDCLRLLADNKQPWKYVQIVSWNDFPLKTNREMVQIFKILNGTTDCDLTKPPSHTFETFKDKNKNQTFNNSIPPDGLYLFKSTYAVMMPTEFVKFLFNSEIAENLYVWLNRSWCSEEIFFATLIYNTFLNAPGGYPGACFQFFGNRNKKRYVARYQIWNSDNKRLCKGYFTHGSCVFGVGDLPNLQSKPSMMAHKLYEEFQPRALYCLEKWHYEKTLSKTVLTKQQMEYYSNLQSVRYHRTPVDKRNNFVC